VLKNCFLKLLLQTVYLFGQYNVDRN